MIEDDFGGVEVLGSATAPHMIDSGSDLGL